jgi:transposase-like protein
MGKPRFDHNFKRELVEAFLKKQITTEEIKAKYGLTKYDVLRFKNQLEELANKLGVPPTYTAPIHTMNNQTPSATMKAISIAPGEETETMLKIQIADLTMELDRAKAKLLARMKARTTPASNKSLG